MGDFFDEYGDSLLHTAARLGKADIVEALLHLGMEPDMICQGECECTPLIVARRWCNLECVRLLMEHGADVTKQNSFGDTAADVRERAESTEAETAQMVALLSRKNT